MFFWFALSCQDSSEENRRLHLLEIKVHAQEKRIEKLERQLRQSDKQTNKHKRSGFFCKFNFAFIICRINSLMEFNLKVTILITLNKNWYNMIYSQA